MNEPTNTAPAPKLKRELLQESLNDFKANTPQLSHRDSIGVLTAELVLEMTKPQPELIPPPGS